MILDKRLMSNKKDVVFEFLCDKPDCDGMMILFRIYKTPHNDIMMEYECSRCHRNETHEIKFIDKWLREN